MCFVLTDKVIPSSDIIVNRCHRNVNALSVRVKRCLVNKRKHTLGKDGLVDGSSTNSLHDEKATVGALPSKELLQFVNSALVEFPSLDSTRFHSFF